MTTAPWGTTRMAPYETTTPAAATYTTVIDPETQVAVHIDEQGRRVDMGGHGTSTNSTTTTSTGGDGQGPGSPSDSDSFPSYDQDQG